MKRVLAVDAPNLDMALTRILKRRPTRADRPVSEAFIDWLVGTSEPGDEIVPAFLVNIPQDADGRFAGWVDHLRRSGFYVYTKPKSGDSDVDSDIIEFIERECRGHEPDTHIVVVSHDARRFLEPLTVYASRGARATVIGFEEYSGRFIRSRDIEFIDLEDVRPSLFVRALSRTRLTVARQSADGTWFSPMTELGRAVSRTVSMDGVA